MNSLQYLTISALLATALCVCPDGWMSFGQSCYLFSKGKGTWVTAKAMCKWHGADLITIETSAEQAEFKKVAETYNHTFEDDGFWLGATDFVVEGKWVWQATEQPLQFAPWGAFQPNNRNGSEDCLAAVKYFDYDWSDEFCDWDHHINYVCEKPETATPIVG